MCSWLEINTWRYWPCNNQHEPWFSPSTASTAFPVLNGMFLKSNVGKDVFLDLSDQFLPVIWKNIGKLRRVCRLLCLMYMHTFLKICCNYTPDRATNKCWLDITNIYGVQTPWTLHLSMPEGVLLENPYNVSLVDIANGRASLRATDPALSLQPSRLNTAIIGFYVNATSMVCTLFWCRNGMQIWLYVLFSNLAMGTLPPLALPVCSFVTGALSHWQFHAPVGFSNFVRLRLNHLLFICTTHQELISKLK